MRSESSSRSETARVAVGDVVEGHAAVAVDGDPEHPPLAGGGELDGLEVEPEGAQTVAERGGDPGAVRTDVAHDATSCAVVGPR